MKNDELVNLIARFAQHSIPALEHRHVYLWHGSWEKLKEAVPVVALVKVDLRLLVADLPQTPRAQDKAAQLLRRTIEKTLQHQIAFARQQVVVVTSCDLLSRYHVPLRPFFDIVSEQRMVILVVPPAETRVLPAGLLPEYVVFDPSAQFEYLRAALGDLAIVDVPEDIL
jgi:hypothetical protein